MSCPSQEQRYELSKKPDHSSLRENLQNAAHENAVQEEESTNETFGYYRFDSKQSVVIRDLAVVMRRCGYVWGLLTIADVFHATTHAYGLTEQVKRVGVPYSDVASIFHDAVTAFVVYNASTSFEALLHNSGNQMPGVFEGIVRMTNLFLQLSFFLTSISVIQLIEAALAWPQIKMYVYVFFTSIAVLRSVAMTYVHTKYSHSYLTGAREIWQQRMSPGSKPKFIDSLALAFSGSFLVPLGMPERPIPGASFAASASSSKEYEFPYWNEQILLAVVESMRMCGLCYVLECMSTLFLASAVMKSGQVGKGLLSFIDIMTDVMVFNVVLHAADAFQRIVTTQGHDVANLMIALGRKEGLTELFTRLGNIACSLVIAQASTSVIQVYLELPGWLSSPAILLGSVMMAYAGYTFYNLWYMANPDTVAKISAFSQRMRASAVKKNVGTKVD